MRVLIYSNILILLEKLREEERKTKMGILKKKALAFALSLLMVTQVVGIHAENTFAAVGNSREHAVSDETEFRKALREAANGDVILINSSIMVNASNNQDNVFVIGKQLTIEGNTGNASLTFREAGILIGADVTFKDMRLELPNLTRNAIFANGHKLTMNNVDLVSVSSKGDLFCGGITDYTGENDLPATGKNGEVIVTDSKIQNIYAGSLVDTPTDAGKENTFDGSADITVSGVRGDIQGIYACGARESRGDGQGNLMYPDNQKYQVTGNVTIHQQDSAALKVCGNPVKGGNTYVIWNGNENLNEGITFTDLAGLSVSTGKLKPAQGSSFAPQLKTLGVDSKAQLDLTNYADTIETAAFAGGGDLVLGADQCLTVTGAVSGQTAIAVGGLFNGQSKKPLVDGKVYIRAVQSVADSFRLYPYGGVQKAFAKDSTGAWTVGGSAAENTDGIHDIFVPKDNSKLERFKARILNGLLYRETMIDVSDIDISDSEIQYTYRTNHLTGTYAVRYIVNNNTFYSGAPVTGVPEFIYDADDKVAAVKFTYNLAWTTDFVKKVVAGYDEAIAVIKHMQIMKLVHLQTVQRYVRDIRGAISFYWSSKALRASISRHRHRQRLMHGIS